MKNILAISLLFGALSASAQSYLILNNGVMLTTDKAGYVYDFGHFVIPYEVKVNGGNFLIEKKQLITVDDQGFKYEKDEEVGKIKGKGLNYLLKGDSNLITVDTKGFYYKYDKDDVFKRVEKFGGNYFLAKDQKKKSVLLYTVNQQGNYFNIAHPELNPAQIRILGGTYFITDDEVIFTVNKDGFVFKKSFKVSAPKMLGGNFLIDSLDNLFTVSEDGMLANPVMPASLNIKTLAKVGANYMVDSEGRLFVVDNNGNVFERSANGHDLRNVKVISF